MRALLLLLSLAAVPAQAAPANDDAFIEVVRAREAEVMERLERADPVRYRSLVALKADDPRAYLRALLAVADERPPPGPAVRDELARIEALRKRYPGGGVTVPAAEQQAVRTELTEIAGRIFAARQEERRRRVEELKLAVDRLSAEISQRDSERDALIRAWVDRVLAGGSPL